MSIKARREVLIVFCGKEEIKGPFGETYWVLVQKKGRLIKFFMISFLHVHGNHCF